jgi:hypothetical protein
MKTLMLLSFGLFIASCMLSLWKLGQAGYLVTILALISSTGSSVALDAAIAGSVSSASVLHALTIFLFLLYLVSAKFVLDQVFFEALGHDQLRAALANRGKMQFPYTALLLLPYAFVACSLVDILWFGLRASMSK